MPQPYDYIGGDLECAIKAHVRDVPDFPKPGILFKDITPILADPRTFQQVIDFFVARYRTQDIHGIVGIESRGFVFGAPIACALGIPLQLARKQGKLPYRALAQEYSLEYGTATIELHVDAIQAGQRVVVIDDLLATGGTARATMQLIATMGGTVAECAFVIELGFLQGRAQMNGARVCSVARYE